MQALIRGETQRKAYREAYPSSQKWVDSAVDTCASTLRASPKVSQRFEELHSRLIQKSEDATIASAKEVLQRLTTISRANMVDYGRIETVDIIVGYEEDDNGVQDKSKPIVSKTQVLRFNSTADVDYDKMSAVESIAQTRDGIRLKLRDTVKAAELLGKHHRLFDDVVQVRHTYTLQLPDELSQDE